MNEREIQFTNYFCLSVYTMRIARYCLEMAKDYAAKPKLKNTLGIAAKAMDARIVDVTLKLKAESRHDILSDLHSDDLQALGNILHHIIQLPSISDVEDQLIELIKNLKAIQNEKMDNQTPEPVEATGDDSGLPDQEPAGEGSFQWPSIETGWQRKQQSA